MFLFEDQSEILSFEELAWDDIITLVNWKELENLLKLSRYDKDKTELIVKGFQEGFDIGYRGPMNRTSESENIPSE